MWWYSSIPLLEGYIIVQLDDMLTKWVFANSKSSTLKMCLCLIIHSQTTCCCSSVQFSHPLKSNLANNLSSHPQSNLSCSGLLFQVRSFSNSGWFFFEPFRGGKSSWQLATLTSSNLGANIVGTTLPGESLAITAPLCNVTV